MLSSSAIAAGTTSKVIEIYNNINSPSFAALKEDGSVFTWGRRGYGSDMEVYAGWQEYGLYSVADQLSSGVVEITQTPHGNNQYGAFAARKEDGSVVTWGYSSRGGDSSTVSNSLGSGVVMVFSNTQAFAALKDDGSVVTWVN